MSSDAWRIQLRAWANACAQKFSKKPDILGVVIGGSLARGQEWRHSDLELGILVEKKDETLPHFNIDAGRGVEVFQLVRPQFEEEIGLVESGDLTPIVSWPIQFWKCRIVYDPHEVMGRFKRQFDSKLFSSGVVRQRLEGLFLNIDKELALARDLLAQAKPAAALVKTRWAMNDAILALHWIHGELPRSQNRTDSRLRLLCKKYSNMPFYSLYRRILALSEATHAIKHLWPVVRNRTLDITKSWGETTRGFFIHAIDSEFKWRQNAGILTVWRLHVPLMGKTMENLDDPSWTKQNGELMQFLGLSCLETNIVSGYIEDLQKTCLRLQNKSRK